MERKIFELSEILSGKIAVHTSYDNEFNLMTQALGDAEEYLALARKSEINEMKKMQCTFIDNLTRCWNNQNTTEFYKIATAANQEIKDWYDRDFNAKDHGMKVAKFAETIVADIVIYAGVAYLNGPEVVAVAIASGVSGLVATQTHTMMVVLVAKRLV